MKKPILLLATIFLVNLGLIGAGIYLTSAVNTPNLQLSTVSVQQPDLNSSGSISGRPVQVIAPKADISIRVKDGLYNHADQDWTISNDAAYYATITPKANNIGGNTFIYGHNSPEVFLRLDKLSQGDEVYLVTDNDTRFTYTLSTVRDVEPTDLSLFEYKGKPILTVQTCAGTWYEKRRLFTFTLKSVEEA